MAGYGTDQGFADFLTGQGHTLPVGAPSAAVLRQRASDYIDATYVYRFPGVPTGGLEQERQWPRTGAFAYGQEIGSAVIPRAVIQASYHAALYEARNPGGLSVVATAARVVTREKIDVLEREYADTADMDPVKAALPMLSAVDGLIASLIERPTSAVFAV